MINTAAMTHADRGGVVAQEPVGSTPLWSAQEFGRWLSAAMDERGVRPSELVGRIKAEHPDAKVSRSYISLIINATPHRATGNIRRPSPLTTIAIADGLSAGLGRDERMTFRNEVLLRAGHAPADVFEWNQEASKIPERNTPLSHSEAVDLFNSVGQENMRMFRAEIEDLRRQLSDHYEAIIAAIEHRM